MGVYSAWDVGSFIIDPALSWNSKLEPAVNDDPVWVIKVVYKLFNRNDRIERHLFAKFLVLYFYRFIYIVLQLVGQ
jgi:hypothetical protein